MYNITCIVLATIYFTLETHLEQWYNVSRMKHRGKDAMKNAERSRDEIEHLDELAELMAWQGYEFWSAQVEAEMEFLADFEQAAMVAADRAEVREGKSDVVPF
jgi:hypothetical protein